MAGDRSAAEAEGSWEDGDWNTDPIPTTEEKPPAILDSKEQIAALFCVEELGVVPPPDTGWVPRDSKDGKQPSKDGTQAQAEWWRNTENREWIYHSSEDKYFHLPSNSLWERRSLDCADSAAEIYTTYFRVDAGALQALSHFAMSLDIGLMPMAFKAWVRFMRKKKDRHFGVPAPPASPGKGKTSSRTSGRPKGQKNVGSPKTSTKLRESTETPFYTSAESVASTEIPTRSVDPADMLAGNDLALPPPASIKVEAVKEEVPIPQQDPVVKFAADIEAGEKVVSLEVNEKHNGSAKMQEARSTEDQPLASKNDKGKGLFCLRCFRSNKARARPDEKVVTTIQPEPTEQSSTVAPVNTKSDKPNQDHAVRDEAMPRQGDSTTLTAAENERPTIDTVERHMRKLECFLELVKKNPQRLVDHVDRRRQEKATLGFIVV